MSLLQPEELH